MSIASRITSIEGHIGNAYDSIKKFGVDTSVINRNIENIANVINDDIYSKLPKVTQSGAGFTLTSVQNGQVDDFKMIGTDLYQNQLPSEYTAVEYLQSDNECFIDTGINADYKLSLKMKVACLDSVLEYMGAIKNIDNTNYIRHHLAFAPTAGNIIGIYYGQTNDQLILKEFDNNFHEFNLDIYNKKVSIDNNSTISISYNNFDVGINYYLFARNGSNIAISKGSYKIAYCKMYYEDNLVRDFAPCYRNSDNVAGLYDFVTNTFFTNQGTGTFTVGNNITLPNPDYPQEIKVVEGRQTITDNGKNLLNNQMTSQTLSGVTFTVNADKSITMSGTASERVEPRVWTKSGTDTLILNNGETYYNYSNTRLIMRIAGDYIAISNNEAYVPSTNLNVDEVYFRVDTNETVDTTIYPMLTKINDNNYEPYYNPVSYNIDLNLENIYLAKMPNTDYKNRIYKNNGNWYYEENVKKIVLDGSEDEVWTTFKNSIILNGLWSGMPITMCDSFKETTNGLWVSDSDDYRGMCSSLNTAGQFKCMPLNDMTLSDFKTWLSTHNVTLWYPLATPVTTQITNTTLINQLEAISVHTGTNIITISNSNNIIPEIEITRLKELEKLA